MSSRFSRARLRRGTLMAFGRVMAPAMLRLSVGRWPDAMEVSQFRDGMAGSGLGLPPLLRGLSAVPAAQNVLQRAISFIWRLQSGGSSEVGANSPPVLNGNLLTVWQGQTVGFMHVEKCAGSAVQDWLCTHFHPTQINDDPMREAPPHILSKLPALLGVGPGCRLIWGHYGYRTFRCCEPRPFVFTVLRDPKERLVSIYRFWRSVDPRAADGELSFAIAAAHRLPFEAFLELDDPLLRDSIDNLYVRRLTGLYASGATHDPLEADPDAALAAAMTAMEELDFVGVSERLDETLARLSDRLGVVRPTRRLSANVTGRNHLGAGKGYRRAEHVERTERVEAVLNRRTQLDQIVYAAALKHFNAAE